MSAVDCERPRTQNTDNSATNKVYFIKKNLWVARGPPNYIQILSIPGILLPLRIIVHVLKRYRRNITRAQRVRIFDRILRRGAGRYDLWQHLQPDNIKPPYPILSGKFP